MQILAIVFVLLFADSAWSQSPDAKNTAPPVSDKSKRPDKTKNNSDSKQTVTIELPPSINVTMGGNLNVKSENDNAKGNDEGANWAERLIALFTGLLVVVTAYLAYYTKELWTSTKTAADDARTTAGQQRLDMQASLTIAKQSADAARDAFIATHKPLLIVRKIRIADEAKAIHCEIANIGGTAAIIHETSAQLWMPTMANLPVPPYTRQDWTV